MTAAETFPERFERATGTRLAQVHDIDWYRVTMVERLLDRADLDAAELAQRLARHCPREDCAAEVAQLIKLHREYLDFLPPDAVPSLDEESEHVALAGDLDAAIRKLVSPR